jgi:hypothetical protein
VIVAVGVTVAVCVAVGLADWSVKAKAAVWVNTACTV